MSSSRRNNDPVLIAILKGAAVTCTVAAVTIAYGNPGVRKLNDCVVCVGGFVLQLDVQSLWSVDGCALYVVVE